jgi:hypothetical protein
MHVLFVGEADDGASLSSHHALLARRMGYDVSFAEGEPWPAGLKPDVIHVTDCGPTSQALVGALARARFFGAGILRIWTSEDALWAYHHPAARLFARSLHRLGAVQAAPCATLAADLRGAGLPAEGGLIGSAHVSAACEPQPLPRSFTVLCHIPARRPRYRGARTIEYLVQRLPYARFLILGDPPERFRKYDNVEVVPHVEEIHRTIQRSTVSIHPLAAGHWSRLLLESLSHGRHAVASFHCPHALLARTLKEFHSTLLKLEGTPRYNLAGREWVCRTYDRALLARWLQEAMERCRGKSTALGAIRGMIQAATYSSFRWLSKRRSVGGTHAMDAERRSAMRLLARDERGRYPAACAPCLPPSGEERETAEDRTSRDPQQHGHRAVRRASSGAVQETAGASAGTTARARRRLDDPEEQPV